MRGPKPPPIDLTLRQRGVLEQLARRRAAPHHLVTRACLILRAAASENNSAIGAALHLDRNRVQAWRTRWRAAAEQLASAEAADPDDIHLQDVIEHLLADAPRPGTPPKFSPEQIVQIVAVACEPPAESERPITEWTARELADEVVKRAIVPSISARSVGRFLK